MRTTLSVVTAVTGLCLFLAPAARGGVVWNEGSGGDLSNDRLNPTLVPALALGSNTVSGSVGPGTTDRDYFTFVVPSGLQLSALVVNAYSLPTGQSFLGLAAGNQVTTDPNAGNAAGLLGWTHFGPAAGNVGSNVLGAMSIASIGSSGFTIPLGPGTYSVWIQETGGGAPGYTLDFQTIPAPGAAAALGAFGLLGLRRRR